MTHTRWLLVLAGLLVAGLAFGGAEQEGAAAEERLTISWMGPNNRGVLLPADSPTELFLEEYFDVELEPWTDVDLYQSDQWKTRIASGDIPDYIKADAIGSGLHDIGAVRVLSEELLRQHMPNYTKLVDQIAGQLRLADGDLGRRGGRHPERQRRHRLGRHLRHPSRLVGGGRRAAPGKAHARLPLLRLLDPGGRRAPAAEVPQRGSGRQRPEGHLRPVGLQEQQHRQLQRRRPVGIPQRVRRPRRASRLLAGCRRRRCSTR